MNWRTPAAWLIQSVPFLIIFAGATFSLGVGGALLAFGGAGLLVALMLGCLWLAERIEQS